MLGLQRCFRNAISRTRIFALVAVAVVMTACDSGSLFLPDSGLEPDVSIQMAESGSILRQSEGLTVSLDVAASADAGGDFDSVVVHVEPQSEIASLSGNGLSGSRERRYDRDELGAELSLLESLEDLETGLYTVQVHVFRGAEEVNSLRRSVFVVDDEFADSFAVDSVSVYPAAMSPGSSGILRASLRIPPGSDPFLRWWVGGELLESGYAADGYDEIEWTAPDHETATHYTVELEMFPGRPAEGGQEAFRSSVRESTDVLVSSSRALQESSLGDVESFFSLYRLQGRFTDDGQRSALMAEEPVAELIGAPRLRVSQGLFGYILDGSSGFESPGAAIPFIGETPAPFTFHARIVPQGGGSGTLFDTRATTREFRFAVETGADGTPAVILEHGAQTARAEGPPGLLVEGEAALLSTSVVPAESRTVVLWFLDGRLVDISELAVAFPASPVSNGQAGGNAQIEINESELSAGEGFTRVGAAEQGFGGLVAEIGILFRDENGRIGTDASVFRDAMESRYAGRLAYARGFQGMFVPDELETIGRVTMRRGALELEPGASVLFPAFLFEHEQLVVELALGADAPEAEGLFRFDIESDETSSQMVAEISSSGEVRQSGETVGSLELVDDPPVIVVRLTHQDGVVQLRGQNGLETQVELETSRFQGVRLTAMQGEARVVPLRIRSVVAHRDRVSLAERLSSSERDEDN
ncbi:MAG: hypothetical protein ACLFNQ_05435 [Spirochaetaceae bacterium]